jgi:glycine cleavage system H protein
MRCPFLREAQVKSCQASAYRKMIARSSVHAGNERCLSEDYVHCPSVKQLHEELPSHSRCPFLEESLVQFCAAAPVTKYIPYTESLRSRCISGRHRYCELFLVLAHPGKNSGSRPEEGVDGLAVPEELYYSRSHLWLDVNEDGTCQIGIDALLAHVLGPVEKVTFLSAKGGARPTAVLTVGGVDLHIVLPNTLPLVEPNTHLRADPARLTSDPYGLGWLFEGAETRRPEGEVSPLTAGLLRGKEAREWLRADLHRISACVHEILSRPGGTGDRILNDGGLIAPGALQLLPREDSLTLFNEFFSPYAGLRR